MAKMVVCGLLAAILAGFFMFHPKLITGRAFLPAGLLARAQELETTALVVVSDGAVVEERWFSGDPRPIDSMSITKTVTALAVGRAIRLGLIASLDAQLGDLLPEASGSPVGTVTLRQIMTHTSGIRTLGESHVQNQSALAGIATGLETPPGATFRYNDLAVNLLGAAFGHATGQQLDSFVASELFGPLGIEHFGWEYDRDGKVLAAAGLKIFPRDLAKIGELIRNGGRYDGQQLIDKTFIDAMMRPSAQNKFHGLLLWLLPSCTVHLPPALAENLVAAGVPPTVAARIAALITPKLDAGSVYGEVSDLLKPYGGISTLWSAAGDEPFPCESDGRVAGVYADGWQGQHLIVLPAEGITIVRMREAPPTASDADNTRYRFREELAWSIRSLLSR